MMQKGAILIAHNNDKNDYYRMAVYTAKRINTFLQLPVSIITDKNSITDTTYSFDNVFLDTPNKNNSRNKNNLWINKGRFKVFEYTPYEETLVLDTDYLINSNQLLQAFEISSDFVCHKNVKWLLENDEQEFLHTSTIPSLWATVMKFKKTNRAQQLFALMSMVQENYEHYANIYKFMPYTYRNDYALAIALKVVNGHLTDPVDYFHWRLWHVSTNVKIYRDSETCYTLTYTDKKQNKKTYIKIKDVDFHVLDKNNFIDLIQ